MQLGKVANGANPDGTVNDNTVYVPEAYNDNIGNVLKLVQNAGQSLIDDDIEQVSKAVVKQSLSTFYTDNGSANNVELDNDGIDAEVLFDGMVIMFTPANANTGATTLKVKTLVAKDLKYNGLALTAGFLATDSKYIAIYSVANNRFDVDLIVNYKNLQDKIINIASTAEAQAGVNDEAIISPLKLREGLNAGGTAPIYATRAWVNLNGTGVVAIRGSGNVSSITDNGTGDYTVNFITAMQDRNYSITGMSRSSPSAYGLLGVKESASVLTTSVKITNINLNGNSSDNEETNISINR